MSRYPYGLDEPYPDDEVHAAYRREWNPRPAPAAGGRDAASAGRWRTMKG